MRKNIQLIVVHGLKQNEARDIGHRDSDKLPVMDGPYQTAFGPVPEGMGWATFLESQGWTLWRPGWYRKEVDGVELHAGVLHTPEILPISEFPLLTGGKS